MNENNFAPKKGLFTASVLGINPDKEQIDAIFGKETKWSPNDYIKDNKDGIPMVFFDIWLKTDNGEFFHLKFNMINKPFVSSTGNIQWINEEGMTMWAKSEKEMKANDTKMGVIFNSSKFRQALMGEETLYNFLRAYLYQGKKPSFSIILPTSDLFEGNFKKLQQMMDNKEVGDVCAMATIYTSPDGKEYQNVYKEVVPGWMYNDILKGEYNFTTQRWVNNIQDSKYGCKEKYSFSPINEIVEKDEYNDSTLPF